MLVFDFTEIGNKLYIFRKKRGLTQADVAELTNLSERTYADIERGKVNMRTETLLRICSALKITPDDVLTKEDDEACENENEIISRLSLCEYNQKKTALKLLNTYLSSLE
ncbi:MAG: helix-turn-helix transcriptional regulator [Clostridia bacterium]|nr:helix-turn-helix transcriptional regulator [Clostridia bacterium]